MHIGRFITGTCNSMQLRSKQKKEHNLGVCDICHGNDVVLGHVCAHYIA